ncbi:hypothetical protein PT974_00836 [Cladobotryum mycophilum]|uniref:Uncharacterized protein n=1 Tax=Cladobotryum mycophilum TaxID=491253 RepID=A0ABR0T206_9HYPO
MAQGEAAPTPPAKGHALKRLTQKEIHEIQQYEKIVRFRDMVLSGNHPTISLPPGLKALAQSIPNQANSPSENGVNGAVSKDQQSLSANANANATAPELEPSAFADTDTSPAPQPVQRSFGSRHAEINPILLEKSDELIKAELQLQRQRLERALKDDIEQRRAIRQLAEPFVVDLSDVLAKALTIVEATATPLPIDEDLTANNEAASDSFDDNTFYSSHHDTPESNLTSRIRDLSEEAHALGTSKPQQQETPSRSAPTSRNHLLSSGRDNHDALLPRPAYQPQHGSPANNTGSKLGRIIVPGLNNYVDGGDSSAGQGQTTSGEQSRSVDSGNPEGEPLAPQHGDDSLAPSPLVRNRSTLLPAAPYPTQTSLLAVRGPIPISPGIGPAMGTPAQIMALRHEPATATKTEVGPHIKSEPRSPSPLTAPSYARPNKRPRQAQTQVVEPGLAEPSYSRPVTNTLYDPHQPHVHRDGRAPIVYESPIAEPPRAVNTAVVGEARYGREYVGEHQVSGGAYMRRPPSPGAPSYQYSPREAHPTRAVSQVIVNDPYREPPRVYREPLEGPRLSVRPEGDSFVVPPRPPPTRIVVDAYGREYIEPLHPTIRQSVAPPVRPGEAEIVYERVPPPRAMSGHPAAGPYDDGGVVYTRPPPSYAVARRYVTQPEYVPHDYRESRPREYSTQPVGAGEYVRIMSPHDRRPIEERPREYVSRSSSLRPSEAVRFEAPHSYGRMHSVRPEVPAREYVGSVHPESRHPEGAPTYVGEYSGSVQQPYARREYSVRPADRYNEPHGVRAPEEIAFIEGPRRPTQEIVYIDDGRRAVYR